MKASLLKRSLFVATLMLYGINALAQADVESPYSIFGVGQIRDKSMNARLKGMGGTTNAMFGPGIINAQNPASYAKIDSLAFLFDAGLYFKTSTFSTSNQSEKSNNSSFDYLAMAFGLTPWWKMAIGAQPYSTSGYTMIVEGLQNNIGKYTTSFKGSGGLNQAFIGNAFKLGKHFAIGANAYYVFGNMQSQTTLYFPDSLYYINTRRSVDMTVSSFMFDYGLLFDTDLGSDLKLSLGLTYDQKINLKGKQSLFIRSIENDATTDIEYMIDTIVNTEFNTSLKMPQGIGFGIALQKNDRWCIGADFNWTQWSKFARHGVNDSLQNSWMVSAGAEFTPRHTSISNYFTKASYRVGGFYEHGYININGISLNKLGMTAGISLPLPKTLSKVNFAVEIGQFGTKSDGLIQENYLNFDVGISVFEHWFMKRKYK